MTGDITSKSDIFKAFEGHDIKAVIHVAGFGLAGTSNLPAFHHKTKEVNVNGTQNIIDACLNFNIRVLGKDGKYWNFRLLVNIYIHILDSLIFYKLLRF